MSPFWFLIKYPVGARGDFLGSFLLGDISLLRTYFKSYVKGPRVAKTHDYSEVFCNRNHPLFQLTNRESILKTCAEKNIVSIGITNNLYEEQIDVHYFHWAKNERRINPNAQIKFNEVPNQEHDMELYAKKDHTWLPRFEKHNKMFDVTSDGLDYIIPFNDLFDIEKLISLYAKIYGESPSTSLIEAAQYSIENNKRFTKSLHYPEFLKK